MWERTEDKLVLLELLETGYLRRRVSQIDAWEQLALLPWTRRTGRRDELELRPEHKQTLVALLDRKWPDWRVGREALDARGLDPTPSGWRRLQALLRAEEAIPLPERLNLRTASSTLAPHSKSGLSRARRAALGETAVTRDGIVRMRPPPGLRIVRGGAGLDTSQGAGPDTSQGAGLDTSQGAGLDATEVAGLLGEVAITERALLDGTVLEGPIRAALLVENLGPFQDLEPPEGWLVVHVPGWNTATVRLFLAHLHDVPILHFGDLDPAGVRIVRHLQELRPGLGWVVPAFWAEYVEKRALNCEWPEDLDLKGAPPLVRELARRQLWLEQEVIAIDGRLRGGLEDALGAIVG